MRSIMVVVVVHLRDIQGELAEAARSTLEGRIFKDGLRPNLLQILTRGRLVSGPLARTWWRWFIRGHRAVLAGPSDGQADRYASPVRAIPVLDVLDLYLSVRAEPSDQLQDGDHGLLEGLGRYDRFLCCSLHVSASDKRG